MLVLRELATCTPTFFFQQVQQFFDVIFAAVRDPKVNIFKKKIIEIYCQDKNALWLLSLDVI